MAEVRIRTHSIKSLDPFCAVQIEASATIPDLNSVIEGLLCNSLDAGATRIDLVVDHSRAACSVEDNGEGIAVINFREGSRLGKSTGTLMDLQIDDHRTNSVSQHQNPVEQTAWWSGEISCFTGITV